MKEILIGLKRILTPQCLTDAGSVEDRVLNQSGETAEQLSPGRPK